MAAMLWHDWYVTKLHAHLQQSGPYYVPGPVGSGKPVELQAIASVDYCCAFEPDLIDHQLAGT